MKITKLNISNIKSHKSTINLEFSKSINILVGQNNSGKSTILNCIKLLQDKTILDKNDITFGEKDGEITISYEGSHSPIPLDKLNPPKIVFSFGSLNQRLILFKNGSSRNFDVVPSSEPDNLLYFFLSKRKVTQYTPSITEDNANSVTGNFSYLFSKIDRLIAPQYKPANKEYIDACNNILGFEISTIAKGQGKHAVQYIHKREHIPITAMGEGVVNMIGLICDLCVAENRIFLIEEIENDIHPKALKALLNLIEKKSNTNQFFISTHSNIVMKYLGASPESKIFNIKNDLNDTTYPLLKISTVNEVSNDPIERKQILEELGYELYDFDLWKAWLFLEESSAEVIIREYLIKWFAPKLRYKLKTFSANSINQVIQKFGDFNRLFVFLHLQPIYKNKVWVYIDSGEKEKEIIDELKKTYCKSGWNDEQFSQFSEHDFERYYPQEFQEEITKILEINNKKDKRKAKKVLLDKLKDWIKEDDNRAKVAFKDSAKEIISVLKKISTKLKD